MTPYGPLMVVSPRFRHPTTRRGRESNRLRRRSIFNYDRVELPHGKDVGAKIVADAKAAVDRLQKMINEAEQR
jgi:hypothetical protein